MVKTMGSRITPHLRPIGGFSADLASATTIGLATLASVPISLDSGPTHRRRLGPNLPRSCPDRRCWLLDRPLCHRTARSALGQLHRPS
jgi:hypothetical protein